MPAKKKAGGGKKKKEILPDPQTLPNGECNYYIGSWSYYQNINDISDIARLMLEQNTNADGEVGNIPRTNILIPACTMGELNEKYIVELSDNMYIESIPKSSMKNAPHLSGDLSQGEVAADTQQEPSAADDLDKEREDGQEAAPVTQKDTGASANARDVTACGSIHMTGVITPIIVKPQLPEPPATKPPGKGKGKGGKRKKSAKVLEEEMQRFEEEKVKYEEQVDLAIAAAKNEENRLMLFAHPNRWPRVVFTNMTFSGPVTVTYAHVTFQNCVFTASSSQSAQLFVSQYCKVECRRCTFECPIKCGVYGFPRGELALHRCLFTGAPQNRRDSLVRRDRPTSAGVHTDDCKVLVEDCRFTELGTGVLLYAKEDTESPIRRTVEAVAVVRGCTFDQLFGTGFIVNGVYGVEVVKNKFADCDYYALDCVKGNAIRVLQNEFLSPVRVQDRAQAKLLNNELGTVPLPPKEFDNPNWQPVY